LAEVQRNADHADLARTDAAERRGSQWHSKFFSSRNSRLFGIVRYPDCRIPPAANENVKDDWLPPKEASGSACFEMPFAFRWTQISSENLPMEEAMMIALKTMIR
jgi:hypothetical protein